MERDARTLFGPTPGRRMPAQCESIWRCPAWCSTPRFNREMFKPCFSLRMKLRNDVLRESLDVFFCGYWRVMQKDEVRDARLDVAFDFVDALLLAPDNYDVARALRSPPRHHPDGR